MASARAMSHAAVMISAASRPARQPGQPTTTTRESQSVGVGCLELLVALLAKPSRAN